MERKLLFEILKQKCASQVWIEMLFFLIINCFLIGITTYLKYKSIVTMVIGIMFFALSAMVIRDSYNVKAIYLRKIRRDLDGNHKEKRIKSRRTSKTNGRTSKTNKTKRRK
jgi:hypothetical protein